MSNKILTHNRETPILETQHVLTRRDGVPDGHIDTCRFWYGTASKGFVVHTQETDEFGEWRAGATAIVAPEDVPALRTFLNKYFPE